MGAMVLLWKAPTKTWCASTKMSVNAATRVFAIARLASALASPVTLVHLASVPLAPMTALDTELAALTGILLTTGPSPKPPRFNGTKRLTSLSCSKKLTLLPTIRHGTATCTTVACVTRDTVALAAPWWSAPQPTLLMTSAARIPQPLTTSCNTMHLSVPRVGKQLTLWRKDQRANRPIFPRVTLMRNTLLTPMAARCTVATVPCLVKIVLAVVSAITLVVHASASVDTPALHARRSKRWRNFVVSFDSIVLLVNL